MVERDDVPVPTRKLYHAPEIEYLGTLDELTAGGGTSSESYDGAGYAPSTSPSSS